ncbi:MAG TPA: SusE domain-containing protein [Flavisolibacter sp.]|jgi:hypothetical protein|nr:SusE domain-containing protein [Flavisolibacter sp.]
MRSIFNTLLFVSGLALILSACEKVADLPHYEKGKAATLTASSTNVAPAPADSNKVALTLNWTFPDYATDSSNVKYTIEIDSAGKNFTNPLTKVTTGKLSTSFTAKELNTFLVSRGYAFNVPVDMDVRLTTSYANNNERITANTVRIKMTPYKIPPKVALPTTNRLFIVGDATQGGWANPVPEPSQEFTRIDETTWGGIFKLNGGKEYLVLPQNGDWGHKFSVADKSLAGLNQGGDFGFDRNDNFPGPATDGLYKIILDFQTGKFTVTPFTQQHGLPDNLYIVGNATPGDWSNPVPVPSQQFTRKTSTVFELVLPLTSGKNFLLLPENGNWGKKFGYSDAASNTKLAGTLKPEGGDMASPDVSGNYKITVDFLNNSYTLIKQ